MCVFVMLMQCSASVLAFLSSRSPLDLQAAEKNSGSKSGRAKLNQGLMFSFVCLFVCFFCT